ncbi:MAG: hypothetical protein Q4B52_04925 [Tissierellia bacterium]|nr:hypothetical protein [Tissierellia bacterium]
MSEFFENENFKLNENLIIVRNKEYKLEDISDLYIQRMPKKIRSGKVEFRLRGGQIRSFSFKNSDLRDEKLFFDTIDHIKNIINKNDKERRRKIKKSQDIIEYNEFEGYSKGISKRVQKRFIDNLFYELDEDEKIEFSFFAIYNYVSAAKNSGTALFCITDDHFYVIYQNMISLRSKKIDIKKLQKAVFTEVLNMGLVTMDFNDEAFNIASEVNLAKKIFSIVNELIQ